MVGLVRLLHSSCWSRRLLQYEMNVSRSEGVNWLILRPCQECLLTLKRKPNKVTKAQIHTTKLQPETRTACLRSPNPMFSKCSDCQDCVVELNSRISTSRTSSNSNAQSLLESFDPAPSLTSIHPTLSDRSTSTLRTSLQNRQYGCCRQSSRQAC
jgi:hypothetical protein